jgi:hypothetical protein
VALSEAVDTGRSSDDVCEGAPDSEWLRVTATATANHVSTKTANPQNHRRMRCEEPTLEALRRPRVMMLKLAIRAVGQDG